MIASVRIGYSVSQHYGAPHFARAISNRLAMSLEDQQVQIVAVFKGEWGCRSQPMSICLGLEGWRAILRDRSNWCRTVGPAEPQAAPTAQNSACMLAAFYAVLVTAGELKGLWLQRHIVQA
jgi:hypothetical protein